MSEPGAPLLRDLRVGTVLEATPHPRARRPAVVMVIDFGPELGRRTTSAQVTANYPPSALVGRQVVAVVDLPPKAVACVTSEVLVLAALCPERGTVLLSPERPVLNGARVA